MLLMPFVAMMPFAALMPFVAMMLFAALMPFLSMMTLVALYLWCVAHSQSCAAHI